MRKAVQISCATGNFPRAARPQHGYGILRDVEEISDGRVRLRAGTLHTALERMSADGWVAVDRDWPAPPPACTGWPGGSRSTVSPAGCRQYRG